MISVPTLAAALGTDILGISWALIVYQVAAIGLGVVCGRLGDVYGHHRMYGFGMAMMAIGSLLCGLSQDVFPIDPVSICARSWRCDDSVFRPHPGFQVHASGI